MHIPFSDKSVMFYSLDVVLAVGYRVNSKRGIMFRKWANNILKNYLIKGYSINETRCLECASGYRMLSMAYENLNKQMEEVKTTIYGKNYKMIDKGDVNEAYKYIINIFNNANERIIIADAYADSVLINMLEGYKVNIIIYTSKDYLDNIKLNDNIKVIKKGRFHSRYIIVDEVGYIITHSINGIYKDSFDIVRLDDFSVNEILDKINKE